MAFPGLPDTRTWNEHEARAVNDSFSAMQGWIGSYGETGQIIPYVDAGCASNPWDYYRKWCAIFYRGFAAEVLRLENAKEQARVQAAADAVASSATPEAAAQALSHMIPPARTLEIVQPPKKDPAAPLLQRMPWGLILAGGGGVLLLARMARRRRRKGA